MTRCGAQMVHLLPRTSAAPPRQQSGAAARSSPRGLAELASLHTGLSAGLRWLYATVQADNALVDPRGAALTVSRRWVRFVPVSLTGTPLIVVDTDIARLPAGLVSPVLNTLPVDELPCLAGELAVFGIGAGQYRYHGLTGTIVLDRPAHPSLRAAVERATCGCPQRRSGVCGPPIGGGGLRCAWRAKGRRAARWPDTDGDQRVWR